MKAFGGLGMDFLRWLSISPEGVLRRWDLRRSGAGKLGGGSEVPECCMGRCG